MILYIENPKDSTKKLLELINEFNNIEAYKINIQKSVEFSYTNGELSEREIKNENIYNHIKNNKIPGNQINQGSKRPIFRKLCH